jgi:hypothetical protein
VKQFNGVKVFSATQYREREVLGETITAWIQANPDKQITDIVQTQSSDSSFHMIAITVFYYEEPKAPPTTKEMRNMTKRIDFSKKP